MKENKNPTIIGLALLIALVVSIVTASITGNIIRLNPDRTGQYNVYTTQEIDKRINDIVQRVSVNGSCQYIYFYMIGDPAVDPNRTARDVCRRKGNYMPQAVGIYQIIRLYNNNTCEGMKIFEENTESLLGKDGPNDRVFDVPLKSFNSKECTHAVGSNFAYEKKYSL